MPDKRPPDREGSEWPDDGRPFSPEERIVLRHFASNYLTGRKFACWVFRVTCAFGALCTALMAIGAWLHQFLVVPASVP